MILSDTASIVIVNFNSGTYLARCLSSITEHAVGIPVVVVDNQSSDGSDQAAAVSDGTIRLIRNSQNAGFARAVNQGLREAAGPWVMILNPDCRLDSGVVERLIGELTGHPECAIAAPQILDEDGSVQGNVRGDPTLLTGLFGRSSLLRRWFPDTRIAQQNVRTERSLAGVEREEQVDWVSGACMMARRSALEAIGGFDERYFLYWEDADLCRRLRDRGFTIRYVPDVRVVHRVGGSSHSAPSLAIRAFHRSAYLYYSSHVAGGPFQRILARVLLEARCWWKLRNI